MESWHDVSLVLHMQAYESLEDRWRFLAPWTAILCDHELRLKFKYESDHSYRREFEAIELTMQDSVMEDEPPFENLSAMAEAVELVATALALHPDAWRTILVDQCECSEYYNPNDEPLSPRFEFDCKIYPGNVLTTKTGLRFFETLFDPTTRGPAFHKTMQRIHQIPRSTHASLSPVSMKIYVSPANEVEDFLLHFIEFVHVLKPYSIHHKDPTVQLWFALESIDFDLTGPELTRELIDRMFVLLQEAPFFQVSNLTIDPREVMCSSEDFQQLYSALVETYPTMDVELGDIWWGYERQFDEDGSDTSSDPKITFVMQTIAATPSLLKHVNVGQLMTRARNERDRRQVVWGHLFETLLHPQAACSVSHLGLCSKRILHLEIDATLIRHAATSSGGYKIPTSLSIETHCANQASLCAIISAFAQGVQYLNLYDSGQPIPYDTVLFILKSCPSLKYLDLNNVQLDSMELFSSDLGPRSSRLSMLTLTNVTLNDTDSLTSFLLALADSSSFVGRHLREFKLGRAGHPATVWNKLVLDVPSLMLVQRVLHYNPSVHTLELEVQDEAPEWTLSFLAREHRQPAAERLAPLDLSSKIALLSSTIHDPHAGMSARHQLSHDVLCLVFEYAAVCMPRWVKVCKSTFDED